MFGRKKKESKLRTKDEKEFKPCESKEEFEKAVAEAIVKAEEEKKWEEIRKEYPKYSEEDLKPPFRVGWGYLVAAETVSPGDWLIEDGIVYEVIAAKVTRKQVFHPDDPIYGGRGGYRHSYSGSYDSQGFEYYVPIHLKVKVLPAGKTASVEGWKTFPYKGWKTFPYIGHIDANTKIVQVIHRNLGDPKLDNS